MRVVSGREFTPRWTTRGYVYIEQELVFVEPHPVLRWLRRVLDRRRP